MDHLGRPPVRRRGELRHDGFLEGFGIGEDDPQIVGSVNTEGDRERRTRARTT